MVAMDEELELAKAVPTSILYSHNILLSQLYFCGIVCICIFILYIRIPSKIIRVLIKNQQPTIFF